MRKIFSILFLVCMLFFTSCEKENVIDEELYNQETTYDGNMIQAHCVEIINIVKRNDFYELVFVETQLFLDSNYYIMFEQSRWRIAKQSEQQIIHNKNDYLCITGCMNVEYYLYGSYDFHNHKWVLDMNLSVNEILKKPIINNDFFLKDYGDKIYYNKWIINEKFNNSLYDRDLKYRNNLENLKLEFLQNAAGDADSLTLEGNKIPL